MGFVYIVLGGYQLFTENTLPPVALGLERLASVSALLWTRSVVLAGNFVGGAPGAIASAYAGVFEPATAAAAADISGKGLATPPLALFFNGAFAGLIIAGVVWLDYAVRDTISRLVLVYIAFLLIPLGDLFHVVVSFTELMYLIYLVEAALAAGVVGFVLPVLLGNTLGGVLLVTVVNYLQTTERRLETARDDDLERQLSVREWLGGSGVGRHVRPADSDGERQRGND